MSLRKGLNTVTNTVNNEPLTCIMESTAVYRIEKDKLVKLLNQHSDKVSRRRQTYRKGRPGK